VPALTGRRNPLNNGKKDRLDRIEKLLEANTKGLADTRELLNMAAAQTTDNAKQIRETRKEFRDELRASAKLHDREMKEIRGLFKQMIRRIAI
jgi:ABC-type transporter Mla subunit MlaD